MITRGIKTIRIKEGDVLDNIFEVKFRIKGEIEKRAEELK
jgi:hypothetical protein